MTKKTSIAMALIAMAQFGLADTTTNVTITNNPSEAAALNAVTTQNNGNSNANSTNNIVVTPLNSSSTAVNMLDSSNKSKSQAGSNASVNKKVSSHQASTASKHQCVKGNPETNSAFLATKWYRVAREKNALYYQAFTMAKPILAENKRNMLESNQVCGVIFDIDETLLDNSAYQADNLRTGKQFSPATWNTFVNKEISVATMGASTITNYVHNMGCKVNLVTNRNWQNQKATEELLSKKNIYFDQVLFNTTFTANPDKNSRFNAIISGSVPSQIATKQVIIGYFGDNIQDFPNLTQKSMPNGTEEEYSKFGKLYFVLPNPIYGSWMTNTYK